MPQAKGRCAQPSGQAGWSSRRAAHQPLLSEAFGELECRVVPEQADQYEPADDEREQLERLAQQYLHTQFRSLSGWTRRHKTTHPVTMLELP